MSLDLLTRAPALFAVAALAACSPDPSDPADGGQFGEENDHGCTLIGEELLDLDEATSWGVTAQDILDVSEGDHASTLTWADGSTAALALNMADFAEPRLLDFEYVSDGSGAEPSLYCPDVLAIDATVEVATDDGQLAERYDVTLTLAESDTVQLSVDLDPISGTFDPEDWATETFDTVWASLSIGFSEEGVSGEVAGFGELSSGTGSEGVVSLSMFEIATF